MTQAASADGTTEKSLWHLSTLHRQVTVSTLQSGGSTLVWFGLTWSLELYQQTVARLWRQGQTSKTVVVQHIITKGTIDHRIMKALSHKEHTQTALIDAVKADLQI